MPTPTCRLPYLACRDLKTWYPAHFAENGRKILPTTIGQSSPSGFSAQLIPHRRSRIEVRTILFFRQSQSQDSEKSQSSLRIRKGRQNSRNLMQNVIQSYNRSVGKVHVSHVDNELRG